MDTKYVIFNSPLIGEFPVLFPGHVQHAMIANCMDSAYPGIKPIRAGFISSHLQCYGRSTGLKLRSNSDLDNLLIRPMFTED